MATTQKYAELNNSIRYMAYPYIQDTSLNINVNVNEDKVHAWPSSTIYANVLGRLRLFIAQTNFVVPKKKSPKQSVREISYMKYICNLVPY